MKISKIHIPGRKQDQPSGAAPSDDVLQFKTSVVIEAQARGEQSLQTVNLDDNDVLELVFEDRTVWFSSSFTLDEMFPELRVQQRSALPGEGFILPLSVKSGGDHRGLAGDIALKVVNIFTKKTVAKNIKKLATALEEKQLDNSIGLFRLNDNFTFTAPAIEAAKLQLLFLHGTASSTEGSFGDLKNTSVWQKIREEYGDQVLAFQHASLTKSPLQNVSELIEALPGNITVDVISQSRGGLVGELLSRFCTSDESKSGFTKSEMDYFEGEYPAAYFREFESTVNKIRKQLNDKKIVIRKFIRVACPAHGTTLASKRLDNFFNISLNLVGLALNWTGPVYLAFKSLAASVVDCKNDVDVLPGLEAMDPRSAFINVLNRPDAIGVSDVLSINNSLTVISGNAKASLSLKGLLVIASKLFYRTNNDLIVDTKSMYLGTKRLHRVQYFFDEGAEVQHFNYFKNDKTRNALLEALKANAGDVIPGFTETDQDSMRSLDREAFGLEGGEVTGTMVTGKRPIVVLLPGIMGSNLSLNERLIWIKYLKLIGGNLTSLNIDEKNIHAPSLIKTSYAKLVEHLKKRYDVVTFPFDWRLQLNTSAAAFSAKIEELMKFNQPVKIIAHSMGGVLVRDFMVTHPQTWAKLNASAGFRLIFLGAPLGGSYRIPAVLFGMDSIIDKLSKIDIFHTKKELLTIFSKFPGILSLLPLTTHEQNDFASTDTWKSMAQPMGAWPLPLSKDLAEFGAYRDAILKAVKEDGLDYSNAVYIAGRDKSTPCGYAIEETGSGKELVILCTAEGDQSVTWESGIPKKMSDAGSVYYVNETHGGLANAPAIFNAINELLENKTTNLISRDRPLTRGNEKLFKQPELFDFDVSEDGIINTLLGMAGVKEEPANETPLKVFVSHGDLKYAKYPVVAGHFLNDGIVNAEQRIDSLLNNTLTQRSLLNLYPGETGTSELLITGTKDFKGAIIVGIGKTGELSSFALTQTIEQATIKYLLHLNNRTFSKQTEEGDPDSEIGLSPLVIGSYYGGLTTENAVRAILTGIQNANQKLNRIYGRSVKNITDVELIEQFEDRAINCFYIVSKIEHEPDKSLNVISGAKNIRTLLGAKKRLAAQTGEEWWTRIKVESKKDKTGERYLNFTLSTTGAREEQRKLYVDFDAITEMYTELSDGNNWTEEVAKTIFELLIPHDFKAQLKLQNNLILLLDAHTATFPWELLMDKSAKADPLCINAGMIRQLATPDYRTTIENVAGNHALVIGDPILKNPEQQLRGAYEEAESVWKKLEENGYETEKQIRSSHQDIYKSIMGKDHEYKIIHLAGHGLFNPLSTNRSGMLIGPDRFLSVSAVAQLRSVEFVFVNCCYLGRTEADAEKLYQDRYRLAANFGTQLINNGVKAVIAAAWKVDDASAHQFTMEFYRSMFEGNTFGESVKKARQIIYNTGTDNTWGAYQCYGDVYYRFNINKQPAKKYSFLIPREAEIALDNLYCDLDTGVCAHGKCLETLKAIADAVDEVKIRNPKITEKEGLIFYELGQYEQAILKFEELFQSGKTEFMVSTVKAYCGVRARKYVQDAITGNVAHTKLVQDMKHVITDLTLLTKLTDTGERSALLGSAHKRLAFLTKNKPAKMDVLKETAEYYLRAYNNGKTDPYVIANYLQLQGILSLYDHGKWKAEIQHEGKMIPVNSAADALNLLSEKKKMITQSPSELEFWDMIAEANLELSAMILEMSGPAHKKSWEQAYKAYEKVWNYAGSKAKKTSEIEQLDLLLDALSLAGPKDTYAKRLKTGIEQLKKELEKIIFE